MSGNPVASLLPTKLAPTSTFSVLMSCTIVLLFVSLLMYKWRRRRLEKLASLMPGPPALPILGNGLEFMGSPEDVMGKIISISSSYESPFRVWIGPLLIVVLKNPEDIQIVLNSSKTLGKDPLYRFFRNTVGTGLFSAPVEKWKKNRKAITPAFNNRLLENFVPVFNEQNKYLIQKLSKHVDKGTFELFDYISAATLDIICQTALGIDVKAQDNPNCEFAQALYRASELDYMRIYKFWLHTDLIFYNTGYGKELSKIYKQLHEMPNLVIKKRKDEYYQRKQRQRLIDEGKMKKPEEEEPKRMRIFLDILLELKDSGTTFTDDDLRDEVVTMMVGGSETSALTNCFCLLLLAMHPEIQDKVYNEVYSIFGDSDREVTWDDLNRLVYLEQVLKETLRRFAVGPIFLREVKEDIDLTRYTIPGGCTIALCPIALHMRSDIYPEPEKFDPDRFLPENIAKRHKYSFIPFSGGPRGCIGSKYAMYSMKTTVSTILRNYTLQTDVKMEDIKLKVDLLMRSSIGYPVTIKPRIRKPIPIPA
ncbi:cytochrome P450 4C1-like [Lycorma delicatula]|uniref:cytochrome P450 4C1-like n=1 Tax=Lycorma delicatula TaxID=130591 RepID=UPI003F517C1C